MGARPLNHFGKLMYYFYVLQNIACPTEFYTGYSGDLRRRLGEHNAGKQQATCGRTWRLVYYEAYLSERVAREREQKIKRNGRMRTLLMDRITSQFSE